MTPTLTAESVGDVHTYIGHARPGWSESMQSIVNRGGPWPCPSCGKGSLLIYRCSRCSADLTDE